MKALDLRKEDTGIVFTATDEIHIGLRSRLRGRNAYKEEDILVKLALDEKRALGLLSWGTYYLERRFAERKRIERSVHDIVDYWGKEK